MSKPANQSVNRKVFILLGVVLLAALIFALNPLLFGGGDDIPLAPVPPAPAAAASPPATPEPTVPPPAEAVASRDPFAQLVSDSASETAATAPTATIAATSTTDPAPAPTASATPTPTPSTASGAAVTVALTDLDDASGTPRATVTVDGTAHTVVEYDDFGGRFRVHDLRDDGCAEFHDTAGADFTLCEGQSVQR